ncbi:MAG TPA: superoxide dismutase family protein [Thermoanaerobaculia bacterium]|nr:superoxide dismutase family protein [Thermoanaerobaculia bacterium]
MKSASFLLIPGILLLAACTTTQDAMTGLTATAVIEPRSGSNVSGTVSFVERADGSVTATVLLEGLTPGAHGFHVHEKGDCTAPDASSAGPHFSSGDHPHGPPGVTSHAGDLGNVTADANGKVSTTIITESLTVSPGSRSVVGRAVVIHADPDDLKSQPAGNAGARIGCGIASLKVGSSMP